MSATSQDRGGSSPLKSRKSGELKSSGQNAGGGRNMPTRNYQKPWPRRKTVGDDELVKYMSSVPPYLQHPGQEGDNPHARALNFGVLDWGLLEKWAYNQKIVTAGRVPDSSSDSNASSLLSPFSSSSQSSRSMNSPLSGKKQTSSSHSVQISQSQPLAKENFKYSVGIPDAKHSSETTPVDQIHVDKVAKEHLSDQQTQTVTLSHNAMKVRDYRSRGEFMKAEISEKKKCSDSYMKQENPANILPASDRPQNRQVGIHKQIEKTQNYLQGNVHRRGTSYEFESITFDAEEPKEVSRISYSGDLPSVGVHYRAPSFYGPHSCPLLPDFQCVELNGARPPTPTPNSTNKHEKHDNFSSISRELFRAFMADESGEDLVKVNGAARGREFPLDHQSSPGLNSRGRSSSLREGSSMHQLRSVTSSETPHVDKASEQSKSRRSPLRRLLDPLVKPKSRNNVSGPIAFSATHRPDERNSCSRALFQDDAVDGSINFGSAGMNSLKCRAESNLKTSNDGVSVNTSTSTLEEKHVPSTRQALLQLAWKNGLPLFMFSSNDNDILAATMKRRSLSNKDVFECVYTIYSVHEVKKKSGIWINQGSKSKKHGLVSDVVGQIKVSRGDLTDHDSRSHHLTRQFVLFGAEVIPTVHEPIDSVFNKELAAVVVKVLDNKKCNDQDINIHIEDYLRRLSLASIVAILPSGIHGSSATGEPSPLIERWKSGGFCDCGGWDEGCMLTILSDKILENKNSSVVQACLTTDGTHRIELFSQGDSLEKKCALSMVAFREGLYTVDFRLSLDLLQAFVICVATLHSKSPPHQAKFPSVEPNNFQEHGISDHLPSSVRRHRDDPTRCLPNHPPISPVERD